MNQRQFEISAIPSNLKGFSNFQKWIYVGNLQDEAMLVGLIEYHIKVNQVQIIQSKLFESNQNNIAMQKINTLLNNSQNKSNRFTSFIEEVKIQDPYGQYFKDAIKSYLKYNYKSSPSEQVKFLCDTFKVQFVIIEQPNQQKLYGIETNGGINKIILYKHYEQYYLILTLIEKTCASCKTKLNLITLDCQHFICFYCLQKPFEQSKQLCSFTCNYFDCKQLIYRHFYLNLQKKYETINCKKCNQNISSDNQQCQNCDEQNKKQQNCSIKQYSNIEQNGQQQNQIQQNQIVQVNELDKPQDITKSSIQNKGSNVQMEIENDPYDVLQKCIKCKKLFIQNQLIQSPCQHYYCKECVIGLCKFRNKFMCLECGFYVETDYIKLSIDKPNQNQDQKCCKCKQLFNETLLFQNQCLDYICASCLEALAQKQTYLRCPQCSKGINIKDADKFLDKILTLKIEQTEQEQQIIKNESNSELNQQINLKQNQNSNIHTQKLHNEESDKNENSQIKIQNKGNLESNLIQLDDPQNCSFCNSPFTEYNIRQFLAYCQDSRHFIGVCCIIFPSDCPQCYFKSLKIEKDNFRFQLPQNISNDTYVFNQYI